MRWAVCEFPLCGTYILYPLLTIVVPWCRVLGVGIISPHEEITEKQGHHFLSLPHSAGPGQRTAIVRPGARQMAGRGKSDC